MRKIFIFFLPIFASFSIRAFEPFPITNLSPSRRDGVIEFLSSQRPKMSAILDCNSFLMGITYEYQDKKSKFLHLHEDHCIEIYETIKYWFDYDESACLLVDFKLGSWKLIKGADFCPELSAAH